METDKSRFLRRSFPGLLVLVPHRDVRRPLRAWSGELFAAGLCGAWSFPWVAPLAALDRRLSETELKALSRALRERLRADGANDGKLAAGPPTLAPLPFAPGDEPAFAFGPSLGPDLSEAFFPDAFSMAGVEGAPAIKPVSPAVLGAALTRGPLPEGVSAPAPPRVAFRAAALAVMRFYPLRTGGGRDDGFSLEWRIGKLHWLPK